MKLLSATARKYRIHREVSIDFDPSRTLIGGPNEAGKSTLIEAIHRGLFLKSKGVGALHKSMLSTLHAGHPEVDVRFESGGSEYTIRKRFSGQTGTTQLAQSGDRILQGDEAEQRLAALLGSEEATGKTTVGKINEQWAHLWVWQGLSGIDPAVHAVAQQSELLQQLQASGGAVAMQSELDGKVAARFARTRDQTYVRTETARSGSDLQQAQTEFSDAETSHAHAAERFGRLQQAVSDYETAETTLRRTAADLEALRNQKNTLNNRIAQADSLLRQEREQKGTVEQAVKRLGALEEAERSISRLRHRVTELQTELEPQQQQLAQWVARFERLRNQVAEADREHESAQTITRKARLRRDLAAAYVAVLTELARTAEIEERVQRVQALQAEMTRLRQQLSELPKIDRARLEILQAIESERRQAEAALNAMAAGVEVISANQTIRVGGEDLSAGGRSTIAESTDVHVGDSVCLRIHPGGGDSLGKAREQVKRLGDRLQASLDEQGLESTMRASEAVAAREDLQGKINGAKAALKALDAEGTEKSFAAAKDALTAAEADVARRLKQVQDLAPPALLAEAKALRDQQETSVQDAEANENSLKATRDALRQQATEQDEQINFLRADITEAQHSLTGFEAQLKFLQDAHGQDSQRAKTLGEARNALTGAEAELAITRHTLQELQPELLESDRERLERSEKEANRQREQAQTVKAVCQHTLRFDGSDDPKASLAQTEARLAAAREHLEAVERKAKAVCLVDDLFQQQQQTLADRFSQPLAAKITDYLQCLFGADAHAVVSFEDNVFKAIQLVRSAQAGAMAFDALSGGTREQVAAAVRLAIAELLAAEHDGSLPVVFDDAFAYSDPERVHVLQRMLDLGAARGLQIIVLTCNPSDYVALGARQVTLAPEGREPRAQRARLQGDVVMG